MKHCTVAVKEENIPCVLLQKSRLLGTLLGPGEGIDHGKTSFA